MLFSAERLPVLEIARRDGVSRPAVWRWQQRYAEEGVDGLLRDKTRKPGRAPLDAKLVARVLELTCSEPPGAATHWTGRAMAKIMGFRCGPFSASGKSLASNRFGFGGHVDLPGDPIDMRLRHRTVDDREGLGDDEFGLCRKFCLRR